MVGNGTAVVRGPGDPLWALEAGLAVDAPELFVDDVDGDIAPLSSTNCPNFGSSGPGDECSDLSFPYLVFSGTTAIALVSPGYIECHKCPPDAQDCCECMCCPLCHTSTYCPGPVATPCCPSTYPYSTFPSSWGAGPYDNSWCVDTFGGT
jgi:hypothetical protein